MRDCGRSGIISYVPPGSDLYGPMAAPSLLNKPIQIGGPLSPFGAESGPAIQIGGTAFGPSQIPSSSVSGSSGLLPVLLLST